MLFGGAASRTQLRARSEGIRNTIAIASEEDNRSRDRGRTQAVLSSHEQVGLAEHHRRGLGHSGLEVEVIGQCVPPTEARAGATRGKGKVPTSESEAKGTQKKATENKGKPRQIIENQETPGKTKELQHQCWSSWPQHANVELTLVAALSIGKCVVQCWFSSGSNVFSVYTCV